MCFPLHLPFTHYSALCICSTILLLIAIYIFYTIPLTFATGLVDPARWANILGSDWEPGPLYTKYLSGLFPALLWTGFFALCPVMFKSLANFGSNALSVQGAGKFGFAQDIFSCDVMLTTFLNATILLPHRIHCSPVLLVVHDRHRFLR